MLSSSPVYSCSNSSSPISSHHHIESPTNSDKGSWSWATPPDRKLGTALSSKEIEVRSNLNHSHHHPRLPDGSRTESENVDPIGIADALTNFPKSSQNGDVVEIKQRVFAASRKLDQRVICVFASPLPLSLTFVNHHDDRNLN